MICIASLLALRSTRNFRRIAALMGCGVAALTIAATPHVACAQTLTGISLFSTFSNGQAGYSGNGNSGGGSTTDIWNTLGGDSKYNLWVSLAGTAINGPLDANANINQILTTPGTYNFTIFGNPGFNQSYHGMNLFFGSDTTNPAISVYAPTASATTEIPAFLANGQTTLDLAGSNTPGAGTLSFSTGGNKVTLTNYRWEFSTVQNQDLVGSFNRAASGGADEQGSFTLSVTPLDAPEPSAFALALTGGVPVLGLVFRRRALARKA